MYKDPASLPIFFYQLLGMVVLLLVLFTMQNTWHKEAEIGRNGNQNPLAWIKKAETLARSGNYHDALPLYEKAIAALAPYPSQQQPLRYRYGIVLNALGAKSRPDLYLLARAQFQSVLDYLDSGAKLPLSAARVRSALAHTYHQQAASEPTTTLRTHLLNTSYLLYKDAVAGLMDQGEWHNLAITYFNLGQVCEWQGNLQEAIAWLDKAVQLDFRYGFPDLKEDRDYLSALRRQAQPIVQHTETPL
ncbi:tetratricopeptide repeat protein [Microbulbifer sp. 2205BS26-8]|uniref:tetratricopeptide repeat protein n=1 Tax=Microbulbifer sp. 2205BS26-8 TaxID=3064386 RepID=UPI0027400726|nr:tetratricopeptide repeat protein [Microbulbifer sp. 2205BS26-8]MDP5210619.1 tetratricopeptide repeat protein [Microbulbifer sp. 2205BS26-8]